MIFNLFDLIDFNRYFVVVSIFLQTYSLIVLQKNANRPPESLTSLYSLEIQEAYSQNRQRCNHDATMTVLVLSLAYGDTRDVTLANECGSISIVTIRLNQNRS